MIGAVQDPELDRYGLGISYLFNRPPDKSSAETASSYAIRSTFHGQDATSPPATVDRVATKTGAAAYWQPNSERVVNVRYDSPISALKKTALSAMIADCCTTIRKVSRWSREAKLPRPTNFVCALLSIAR